MLAHNHPHSEAREIARDPEFIGAEDLTHLRKMQHSRQFQRLSACRLDRPERERCRCGTLYGDI